MPEKFINSKQRNDVIRWCRTQASKTDGEFGPNKDETVLTVNDESLHIVFTGYDYDEMYHVRIPKSWDELKLVCSDKHAQGMEAAGVLRFSDEQPSVVEEVDPRQANLFESQ